MHESQSPSTATSHAPRATEGALRFPTAAVAPTLNQRATLHVRREAQRLQDVAASLMQLTSQMKVGPVRAALVRLRDDVVNASLRLSALEHNHGDALMLAPEARWSVEDRVATKLTVARELTDEARHQVAVALGLQACSDMRHAHAHLGAAYTRIHYAIAETGASRTTPPSGAAPHGCGAAPTLEPAAQGDQP